MNRKQDAASLDADIAELRLRLEEAEDMRRAITSGEVDAFVVGHGEDNRKVLLLAGAYQRYRQVVERAQAQLQDTGASWIATTDYRTYAMLRWHFNGQVPVIQVNERGRFQGFADPGMEWVRGHTGLYVARELDNGLPLWKETTAVRTPLERVERSWRGVVMDTYALEKLEGWTPQLAPPKDSPLFRWRVLA